MPHSFLLHLQEEVEDDFAEDLPRGEQPVSSGGGGEDLSYGFIPFSSTSYYPSSS